MLVWGDNPASTMARRLSAPPSEWTESPMNQMSRCPSDWRKRVASYAP